MTVHERCENYENFHEIQIHENFELFHEIRYKNSDEFYECNMINFHEKCIVILSTFIYTTFHTVFIILMSNFIIVMKFTNFMKLI